MPQLLSRRSRAMLVATIGLLATACKLPEPGHPEVEVMRLTLAGQAPVLVNSVGAVSGTLTLTQNVSTLLTVEFLDANQQDALVDFADEYRVNVATSPGLSWVTTGAYTGTITASVTGPVQLTLAMFHLTDAEEEFGPFPVTITVNP